MAAMNRNPIASIGSPIQKYLETVHACYRDLDEGEVASYIPELFEADPHWFGICIATSDGQIYEVGESRRAFTIQSISKPFVYGMAMEDRGVEHVLAKIGLEPSGDAFNSISLHPETGCPLNPMINAGAITTTSLVGGATAGAEGVPRMRRILETFARYVAHEVAVDEEVYRSESDTGHRNRAIGYMLRSFEIIEEDPMSSVDDYFHQCSISVDCRDLAVMGATLANGGVNPLSGVRALDARHVESVLSVMTSCGMYDYAGEWIYRVGMPAKSGVAGGIVAVLPGQLGIGVYSPPLDERGNSVRGIRVCRDLSRELGLHFLRAPRTSRSTIRSVYDATRVNSKRLRSGEAAKALESHGDRIRIVELQGELSFASAEIVVRKAIEEVEEVDYVVVDLRRVLSVDAPSARLFAELREGFRDAGKELAFSVGPHADALVVALEKREAERAANSNESPSPGVFRDLDVALEWCEERLLRAVLGDEGRGERLSISELDLCRGLDAAQLAILDEVLEGRNFAPGEYLVRRGDPADAIYLIARGEVSVGIQLENGERTRVATLSAGMTLGETAIVTRGRRTADVYADGEVECFVLSLAKFDELDVRDPSLKIALMSNLLGHLSKMVGKLTNQVAELSK